MLVKKWLEKAFLQAVLYNYNGSYMAFIMYQ